MSRPPRLLTVAGSDSGGGAGIQADLKTFEALGCYGMSVVTAITAQNTTEVRKVQVLPPEMVVAQLEAVLDDIGADAVKVGMLGSADVIAAVAAVLEDRPPMPLVLDPVMVAKSGDSLLEDEAVEALVEHLLPRTTLLTPNLPEAARLTGLPVASGEERAAAARHLEELGASAVLVKGGHGIRFGEGDEEPEDPVIDWLWDGHRLHRYENPRIDTRSDHGTGCTLSSAIAAEIACGAPLPRAVELGLGFLRRALEGAVPLGRGRGPLRHGRRYRQT